MNNNNKIIIPLITYAKAGRDKSILLTQNHNKSGISRLNNLIIAICYIESSVNLAGRLSIYYSKKAILSLLSIRTSIIYSLILKHDYVNFNLYILKYCEIERKLSLFLISYIVPLKFFNSLKKLVKEFPNYHKYWEIFWYKQ
jgi:hypothetical protein